MIDSLAIVHPEARINKDVTVEAYSIVGPQVEIGAGTHIGPHVVIKGPAKIGRDNRIYQFCSIGDDPQDKKYTGEGESGLVIGDGNTIREYCSINRGTPMGGGQTVIGNDNWIMAYVHIAHDCKVGDSTVFANNATLAGHVLIEDNVILGGFTGIHQYCRVGRHSLTAISSVVVKDVPPFLIVSGNNAKPSGINREGLKRHGYPTATVDLLKKAYRILYRDGLTVESAIQKIRSLEPGSEEVEAFVNFILDSERGIVR